MSENIKTTAITASGYIYQNRQGLKVLCDWLDAPSRYNRVKFECDTEEEAPQGLDDIVIERSDGRIDFQQIKFTPNPDKHLLSWDWLLHKSGNTARSRSMLRKWFDAFKQLDPVRIGETSLITNRRPDSAIEACLEKGRISFAKIPELQRSEIVSELGSVENCEAFFNQLHIQHSDKGYLTLEHHVDARLRIHGTPEGIATLKNVALNWSTLKNSPAPDGWITLIELHTILRALPPAPLPEDFIVPKGCEVPDETFHQKFIQDTISSSGKAIVLTGPPGRGKSTYLSALCDTLVEGGIPTVRHHYFLSTTERGRDRIDSFAVEQSIKAQIQQSHEDVPMTPGGLRKQLEACSSHYKTLGKPLVLILDGLDHVWRINSKDKRPLDDLFSQLIPCPDNMVLLVGTQPVDDAQLPNDLLAFVPKSEWHTLPAMSENAVLSYLRRAVQEGRLIAGFEDERQIEELLQDSASALHERTNGHPLHVIYATAELENTGDKLYFWSVEQLKGDLSQDAWSYYASLWVHLLPSQKDTLRLICAFPFFWPKSAFSEIAAAIKAAEPDVDKVQHLLHSSAAGLKVFHESLAVFVRKTEDYEDRINELMPEVANWLEQSAPTSLSVNWLWTVQAKLGNPANLITGLTRDWIMHRLEEGYPESLFDTLLSEALIAALETKKFADAYRLNHLKNRMVDGSQFQIEGDDMARLISFTLALTEEESVIHEAFASRHEADILKVAALGLALQIRGDQVLAETCGEEALHRFNGLVQFSNRYNSRAGSNEFAFLVNAFTQLGTIGASEEAFHKLVEKNSQNIWLPRVQMLVNEGSLDDLMEVTALISNGKKKNTLSDACVRAAAKAGVNIARRDDFDVLARTPLVATVEALLNGNSQPLNQPIPVDWLKADYFGRKEDLANLVHHWFFSAIHLSLYAVAEDQTDFNFINAPVYEGRENITQFLNALTDIGSIIAHRWQQKEFVDFQVLFELLEPVIFHRFRESHDKSSATDDFRSALHKVACDIRICSVLINGVEDVQITSQALDTTLQTSWFDSISFRTQYAAGSLTRMTDEAATKFVQSQSSILTQEIQDETSVHLQTPLQLCAIAVSHRITPEARSLCKLTWELVTGYSHRKDPTLGNTLDAISYLVDVAEEDARRLLGRIAPQIHNILNYTDGKGTRHALTQADQLLAKLRPSALVVKYEEHTEVGEWWQAEDSLKTYIEQGVIKGWPLDALMRTGLTPEIRGALEQLAQEGNTTAAELLGSLDSFNGWDVGFLQRTTHSESSIDIKHYEGNITEFEPEQLPLLLKSLESHYEERKELLHTWYRYWESKRQSAKLLTELDKILFSDNMWMREALTLSELAFRTKHRISGLPKAWKYLVHAQIRNGGWTFMEKEEETLHRLNLIAQHYLERCDEFVTATTYSMFDDPLPTRIAPSEVMVYFYIKQNRINEAVKFTETMVSCVLEDTRTLPLETPRWMTELTVPSFSGLQ